MKYRVISGCVTVSGPPFAIWRRKIGITEPDEPSTLPKRTATNRVATSVRCPNASTISSQTAFDWPITVFAFTALSVEIEDEAARAELDGDLGERSRGERVVPHRLDRVGLDQRHVLVRRGVEDDRRPVGLEDLAHLRRFFTSASTGSAAGKPRSSTSSRSISKRAGSAWSTRMSRAGADARDLPAELGADRAAGAGDQHRLAGEVPRDRLDVDLDRLAAEHVLDLDRTDLAREVEIAGDQLVQARQRLHRDALAPCDLDDPLPRLTGGGRDCDQELVRPSVTEDVLELGARPEHPDAVQPQVLLARVVVDQARSACSRARACAASRAASAGPRPPPRRRSPPCRARRSSSSAAAR